MNHGHGSFGLGAVLRELPGDYMILRCNTHEDQTNVGAIYSELVRERHLMWEANNQGHGGVIAHSTASVYKTEYSKEHGTKIRHSQRNEIGHLQKNCPDPETLNLVQSIHQHKPREDGSKRVNKGARQLLVNYSNDGTQDREYCQPCRLRKLAPCNVRVLFLLTNVHCTGMLYD